MSKTNFTTQICVVFRSRSWDTSGLTILYSLIGITHKYDSSFIGAPIFMYTVAALMNFLIQMKCTKVFRREKHHNMFHYSIWIEFSKHQTLSNTDSLSNKNINTCNILIKMFLEV